MNLTAIGLILFAAFFLGVGIWRIVEFSGLGISEMKRVTLVIFHICGCLLFSTAVVIIALDQKESYRVYSTSLFVLSIVQLFPVHIYTAFRRRLLLRKP